MLVLNKQLCSLLYQSEQPKSEFTGKSDKVQQKIQYLQQIPFFSQVDAK